MSDTPATSRFSLPLLVTAQAQKEITHNGALLLVDALLHAAAVDGPVADPPAAPALGDCWIVADGPSGAWAGHPRELAVATAGGWRFVAARQGMAVRRLSDGALLRFEGSGWEEPAPLAPPTGGVTVDIEARATIGLLISRLAAHGMVSAV